MPNAQSPFLRYTSAGGVVVFMQVSDLSNDNDIAVSDNTVNASVDAAEVVEASSSLLPEISIGTTSFRELRELGQVYVDKTDLVASIANDKRRLLTLMRPTGFGKSILISTLEELYSTGVGPLFDGLAIKEQHLCPHIEGNAHKVLTFHFFATSTLDPNTFEKAIITDLLEFCRTYNLTVDTTRAQAALDSEERGELLIVIHEFLPAVLRECGPHSTVILVDRYDGPLLRTIRLSKWDLFDRILNTLSLLCQIITTHQKYIEKALFVGWLHHHYHEIFGEGFGDLSFDPHYQNLSGFTITEICLTYAPHIEQMAAHYAISVQYCENLIEQYFDGFYFSPEAAQAKCGICNPMVILMLFKSYEQYPDFVHSCPRLFDIDVMCFRYMRFYSDPEAKYAERNGGVINISEFKLKALESLCVNMPIKKPLESFWEVGEFLRLRFNFAGYMHHLGYLCFNSGVITTENGAKYCMVAPPNKEMLSTYKAALVRIIGYHIGFDDQVNPALYVQELIFGMQKRNADTVSYVLNKIALNLNSKARELLGDNEYALRTIMRLSLVVSLIDNGPFPEVMECGENVFIDILTTVPEQIHQLWHFSLANAIEGAVSNEIDLAPSSEQDENLAMIMTRDMTDIQHLVEDNQLPPGHEPDKAAYLAVIYDAKHMRFIAKYVDIHPKPETQQGNTATNRPKQSWWARILSNIF